MQNNLKKSPEISFTTANEWRNHFLSSELSEFIDSSDEELPEASDLSEMLWEKIRSQPSHLNASRPKEPLVKRSRVTQSTR